MNIFWLSVNTIQNANLYNDQHVIKIILEICQCLMSAMHHHARVYKDDRWQVGMTKIYKMAHKHHPVVLWITEHPNNFKAASIQALSLCVEYTKRNGKTHACQELIIQLMARVPQDEIAVPYKAGCVRATINIPIGCTPVPLCMPIGFIVYIGDQADLTASYINFYRHKKLRFDSGRVCTWPVGSVPQIFLQDYQKIISE